MAAELASADPQWDYAARITDVRARIVTAETVAGRHGAGVKLLVATKSWDAASAAAAVNAGARLVGESRMQELELKASALKAAGARIHVIGQLQRNKAQIAVKHADCVQTVDNVELAERLDRLCSEAGRSLDVMIQVNVSGESSKAGVEPHEALALASAVQSLPALHVTGFMTIGLNSYDEAAVREGYANLRSIRDEALIRSERGELALADAWELSMGMSHDLEWAIAEGATLVRAGTAVMGSRS